MSFKRFLSALVTPAGLRTVVACLAFEALVVLVLYYFTHSLAGSIILSIVALGPASLFVAAPIYRYFSKVR